MKQHTISVLVKNKFGVLARVAGLFSGRGYNISSLTVNSTDNPEVSKMTIVTIGDDNILEQVDKQLKKLIDVISVHDLTGSAFVEREIALVKVCVNNPEDKSELLQIAQLFGAKFVTAKKGVLGVELSGRADTIDNFLNMIEEFEILDVARSGRVAISRD